MRKLRPRKKQFFLEQKNSKKRVSEQKRDSAKFFFRKAEGWHTLTRLFQTPHFTSNGVPMM